MSNNLIYEGIHFRILSAIRTNGSTPALDFIMNLDSANRAKVHSLIERFADYGEIRDRTKFNKLSIEGLYEFKTRQVRMPCYFNENKDLIITHGFIKKTNKTPPEELRRAKRIRSEYIVGRKK